MSVTPLHVLLGGLLIAVVVSVALVPMVIEPTLYRRKFQLGTCSVVNLSYHPSLIDCSCGFSCVSKKKCLIAKVEYTVNLTDPTVRYYSNETRGEELLNDEMQRQTSEIHCTNTGCTPNSKENEERANTLMDKLRAQKEALPCRVNVDSPEQERVYDASEGEEEEQGHVILMTFLIPWAIIYVLLIAIAILEPRIVNQTEKTSSEMTGIEDSRFEVEDQEEIAQSQSHASTPSTGSRRELVGDDKILVDFSGGAVVFKKRL